MSINADLAAQVSHWLAQDPDPQTQSALQSLFVAAHTDNNALIELTDAFVAPLAFGTAGLRGALGAGPNRMNRVTVLQAAVGLANYLLSQGFVEDGVVECPLHAARFEINGGKCLNDIGQRDLRCYPVKVEADRVWVQVPQA